MQYDSDGDGDGDSFSSAGTPQQTSYSLYHGLDSPNLNLPEEIINKITEQIESVVNGNWTPQEEQLPKHSRYIF